MKIKSAILTQASGSIGGMTASRNAGGMYFRARAVPVDPQSSFQTAVRNAVNQLVQAWQDSLTESQREAWRTYAANVPLTDVFGDSRLRSGQQHYIRSNTPRLQAGLDRVDDGPTTFNLGEFNVSGLAIASGDPGQIQGDIDDTSGWVDDPQSGLLVYASRDQSAARQFFKGPYRFADVVVGDDTTPPTSLGPIDAPFPYANANAAFLQMRVSFADGRLTSVQRFRAVIS